MIDEQDPSFGALLEFLKRSRGFDFSGYKRASLARRFRRRMETIEVASFGDYVDYLEVHPDEYEQLFNTLLINVTEFFRDPPPGSTCGPPRSPRSSRPSATAIRSGSGARGARAATRRTRSR